MEDDLKLLKAEHFSNHLLDPTQISNLSLAEQTLFFWVKIFFWVNSFGRGKIVGGQNCWGSKCLGGQHFWGVKKWQR